MQGLVQAAHGSDPDLGPFLLSGGLLSSQVLPALVLGGLAVSASTGPAPEPWEGGPCWALWGTQVWESGMSLPLEAGP